MTVERGAVVGTDEEVEALLVTSSTDWAKELSRFASRSERQRFREDLMGAQEQNLRARLRGLPVSLERLEAIGAWTVRGKKTVLACLHSERSPLQGTEFSVVPDAKFETT